MSKKKKLGILEVLFGSKKTSSSKTKKKSSSKSPKKTKSSNTTKKTKKTPAVKNSTAGKNNKKKNSPTPVGRTLKTKDEFLPQKHSKVKELKERRWVAVIETNKKNELAVVRLTDEKQANTTLLPEYKKGNQKDTYFKHFVETKDNEGNPIKASKSGKFQENPSKYDLSSKEIDMVKSKTLKHCKQSTENEKKIVDFRNSDKKKR